MIIQLNYLELNYQFKWPNIENKIEEKHNYVSHYIMTFAKVGTRSKANTKYECHEKCADRDDKSRQRTTVKKLMTPDTRMPAIEKLSSMRLTLHKCGI